MRTGAAAGHAGFFHETALYGSDAALVELTVPFIRDGVAAGEPTVVTFGAHNAAITREALGDTAGVTFIDGDLRYARPAVTIRQYRELFARLVGAGATQIRVIGDVPHPGTGVGWDAWARYEAVVNEAYDEYPVWGVCPYDTRTTPASVLADVERTHPHIVTAEGTRHPNRSFVEPDLFLANLPVAQPLPLESVAADIVMIDPEPRRARQAAAAAAQTAALPANEAADLEVAISELLTNAHAYGCPPVTVELWVRPRQVTALVSDTGRGPDDPAIGLLPCARAREQGGLGLWIVHQLCADVALRPGPRGFSVRIVVGDPPALPAA